jgi:hypothetical protein
LISKIGENRQAEASSRLLPLSTYQEHSEDIWRKHGQDYLDHILKVTEQEVVR